jgi:3-hydroxyisobutyrate dehydrogenase-like beta-hydroxyacid dehydrogenase
MSPSIAFVGLGGIGSAMAENMVKKKPRVVA